MQNVVDDLREAAPLHRGHSGRTSHLSVHAALRTSARRYLLDDPYNWYINVYCFLPHEATDLRKALGQAIRRLTRNASL